MEAQELDGRDFDVTDAEVRPLSPGMFYERQDPSSVHRQKFSSCLD